MSNHYRVCGEQHLGLPYTCTRPVGHQGAHQATGYPSVVPLAEWDDEDTTPWTPDDTDQALGGGHHRDA